LIHSHLSLFLFNKFFFIWKFSAKLAIPKIHTFLLKWPTPEDVTKADPQDLLSSVENLGLENTRVKTIKRFTGKYYNKSKYIFFVSITKHKYFVYSGFLIKKLEVPDRVVWNWQVR